MRRIAYFISHPIQYFSPLFRELAKRTDLKVYYFSNVSITGKKDIGFGQNIKWDVPLLDGYNSLFVKNYSSRISLGNKLFDVFNPGVVRLLLKERANVVIVNGWTYSTTLMCIFFGRLFGKKVWLRAENPENQELRKGKMVLLAKKFFLKYILFKIFVDKCLYIGNESRKFFEFYGVPAYKLLYTPYAVDNDFFSNQYYELKKDTNKLKKDLQLPIDKKIILFCGKYISKKRPLDLLKAFHKLNAPTYALVMIGEGELRSEMEQFITLNRLQDVYLTGFVNQSDISKYYTVADVFVMCSGMGETWGLSTNEAMNFENPIIISSTCGCCNDLVKYGENGYSFREGDISELQNCIRKILDDDEFRFNAGKLSAEVIKKFSIENIVSNIESALEKTNKN